MNLSHGLPLLLHALLAVIWVGGMFFAHMVLRPTALAQFEGPVRLKMWAAVFGRFFPWVWGAALLLPATGFWMIFASYGGFGGVHWSVHAMSATGLLMSGLFAFLYFVPYRRLRGAVAGGQWPVAAGALDLIRRIVITNLGLGLFTVAVGSAGRFLG